jgi:hypothetical protein
MAKKPGQSPVVKATSKSSSTQLARLRELSGSGALIAGFQVIPNPLLKAVLSCFAPAVIEIFFYLVDSNFGRLKKHMENEEKIRVREQKKKDLEYKLSEAEARLEVALADPGLSAEAKQKLKEAFANTKVTLAERAMSEIFVEENVSIISETSQGSAAG